MQNFRFIDAMVSEFRFFKEEEEEEEHGQSVKNIASFPGSYIHARTIIPAYDL